MSERALRLLSSLVLASLLAGTAASVASADEPPRFQVSPPAPGSPLVFVVYGDTRFTQREKVANAYARRALVARIAQEHPAAILIGGDLVY